MEEYKIAGSVRAENVFFSGLQGERGKISESKVILNMRKVSLLITWTYWKGGAVFLIAKIPIR